MLASTALLTFSTRGSAQTIDQSQPLVSSAFANLNGGYSGQTFVQAGSNISGVGIKLRNPYNQSFGGNVEFNLYTGVPSAPGTETRLTGQSTTFSLAAGTDGWLDFFFAPIALSDQSLFFNVFGANNALQTLSYVRSSPANDAYPSGEAYLRISTDPVGPYNINPQTDLTFRTYTTTPGGVAPEPISLVLLGTGLVGVGVVRLRQRRINGVVEPPVTPAGLSPGDSPVVCTPPVRLGPRYDPRFTPGASRRRG